MVTNVMYINNKLYTLKLNNATIILLINWDKCSG